MLTGGTHIGKRAEGRKPGDAQLGERIQPKLDFIRIIPTFTVHDNFLEW